MLTTVGQNKRGFTLVEVVIAMFLLLVCMLGLLNAAVVMMEHNLGNILRDEAIRVGAQEMNGLKNTDFDVLTNTSWVCAEEGRKIRGGDINYNVCSQITSPSVNTRQLEVAVGWNHRGTGSLEPTGRKYQHGISSLVSRGG